MRKKRVGRPRLSAFEKRRPLTFDGSDWLTLLVVLRKIRRSRHTTHALQERARKVETHIKDRLPKAVRKKLGGHYGITGT